MQNQDDDKTIVADQDLELLYSIQSQIGENYPINDQISIGRSSDNTIFIDDKKISRKHAVLSLINNRLQIEDLKSSNGTFVNGERIHNVTTLKNKDTISFEKHLYTVNIEMKDFNNENVAEDKSKTHQTNVDETDESIEKSHNEVSINHPRNNENIPSSWVEDSGTVAGTRMMDINELNKLRAGINKVKTNKSGNTQIHCFIDGVEEIFQLPIENESAVSGWEIGRDSSCDIVINHSSVSGRHAQIIHQNGRWKIVNLVSTNGILINGQRKLSTFLADGDKVGLGTVDLIFNIPTETNKISNKAQVKKNTQSSKSFMVPVLLVILLLVLSAIIYLLINK